MGSVAVIPGTWICPRPPTLVDVTSSQPPHGSPLVTVVCSRYTVAVDPLFSAGSHCVVRHAGGSTGATCLGKSSSCGSTIGSVGVGEQTASHSVTVPSIVLVAAVGVGQAGCMVLRRETSRHPPQLTSVKSVWVVA